MNFSKPPASKRRCTGLQQPAKLTPAEQKQLTQEWKDVTFAANQCGYTASPPLVFEHGPQSTPYASTFNDLISKAIEAEAWRAINSSPRTLLIRDAALPMEAKCVYSNETKLRYAWVYNSTCPKCRKPGRGLITQSFNAAKSDPVTKKMGVWEYPGIYYVCVCVH